VISNIAAGTTEQVEMIIKNDDYMKRLKTAIAFEDAKDVIGTLRVSLTHFLGCTRGWMGDL